MIQPHIAYTYIAQLQPRQWDWGSDVGNARTTKSYDRWFVKHHLIPLIDLDIPVPKRQEDLSREEEHDEDYEGEEDDGDEDDDEDEEDEDEQGEEDEEGDEERGSPMYVYHDQAEDEPLQDISIGDDANQMEQLQIHRATVRRQRDNIAQLEQQIVDLRLEKDQCRVN